MWDVKFWRDAIERALATAAQAALLTVGADLVNVMDTDWAAAAGFAAGGAVLSILKALAARQVGSTDSASLDPTV